MTVSNAPRPAGSVSTVPWRKVLLWSVAVLPMLVLAAAHWRMEPAGHAGDYAQYLLHAKAIADGRPYGDIGYLYTPYNPMIGPPLQPPGWPLLLAPGVAVFGTGLLFPKILVTLAALVFLSLAAVRLGRGEDRWIGLASAAAAGAGLEASFATNSALSDLPFAAILWGVILLADSERPLSWGRVGLIGLLGSFSMTVRVMGFVLCPAMVLLAVLRPKDRRKLLALGLAWAMAAIAALAVLGLNQVPFLLQAVRGPSVIFYRLAAIWERYHYPLFESLLYPAPWDAVNDVYHVLTLVVLPLGIYEFGRRFGRSALGCVTLAYGLTLAVAPVADGRYLWPLWPVVAYCLFAGMRRLASWVPRWGTFIATRVVPVGASVLVVAAVLADLRRPGLAPFASRQDVRQVFAWASAERAREAPRVVFVSPRVLTLYTGVPAMGYFRAPRDQVAAELRRVGITHVVIGDAGAPHPPIDGLLQLMEQRPDAFQEVLRSGDFTVFRVTPRLVTVGGEPVASRPTVAAPFRP